MKLREGWQNPSQKSKLKASSTERVKGKEGERCIEKRVMENLGLCSCTWLLGLKAAHSNGHENTSVNPCRCCRAWTMIPSWINLTELHTQACLCVCMWQQCILIEINPHFSFFCPMHNGINACMIHQKLPQSQNFLFTTPPPNTYMFKTIRFMFFNR